MNLNSTFSCLLLCLFFGDNQLHAQVKTDFNSNIKINDRGKFAKQYAVKANRFTKPDIKPTLDEERRAQENVDKVFFFAHPVKVRINVAKEMAWTATGDSVYGLYRLVMDEAKSLSVQFSDFYIPGDAEMFIYNKEGIMITGPVTSNENNGSHFWGSAIYEGEELNIEIRLASNKRDSLKLILSNIAYGYKNIFVDRTIGFGNSESCNINVLCPLGAAWGEERNSVALITRSDGAAVCTGAMVMNTCGLSVPYLLTANHCYATNPVQNVGTWRFIFQAWSPACTPNQNSNGVLFNGSTLRATNAASDFCLVELNQIPATNSGIRYAGWNRSATPATNVTGIHHPNGDVMKISNSTTGVIRSGGAYYPNTTHWEVNWTQGITASGSSGSPLFDQNHRIVGQLHGGTSFCATPTRPDWYGSFDQSWTGGGTAATRLSSWLDPSNSGAITTNTTNISALTPYIQGTATLVTGPTSFCNSATFTTNLPAGTNVIWSVTQPGSTLSCTNCPSTTLTMVSAGPEWVTATVNACSATPHSNTLAVKNVNYSTYSNFGTYGPHVFCKNATGTIGVDQAQYPGLTGFTWALPAGWTKLSGGNGFNNITVKAPNSTSPPTFTLNVTATNVCGGSSTVGHFLAMSNCTAFMLAPNPVNSSTLTIQEIDENTGKIVPVSNIEIIEIIDKMGYLSKRQQFRKGSLPGTVTIPAAFLKNGPHILRIFDGLEWKNIKFIVNK